jgi:hypothetical protein
MDFSRFVRLRKPATHLIGYRTHLCRIQYYGPWAGIVDYKQYVLTDNQLCNYDVDLDLKHKVDFPSKFHFLCFPKRLYNDPISAMAKHQLDSAICMHICLYRSHLIGGGDGTYAMKRDSIQDNKAAYATSVQPQLLIRHNRLVFSSGGMRPPVEILNPAHKDGD